MSSSNWEEWDILNDFEELNNLKEIQEIKKYQDSNNSNNYTTNNIIHNNKLNTIQQKLKNKQLEEDSDHKLTELLFDTNNDQKHDHNKK